MGNYICLPCNDSTYGQIGCKGNCEPVNIKLSRYPYCEKDGCLEGFFYREGFCENCSEYLSNCAKCSYEIHGSDTYESLKCLECKSNQYKLSASGICEKCSLDQCEQCHYNEYYNETICDKCNEDYYLNEKGECEPCRREYLPGGVGFICSKYGNKYDYCKCHSFFAKAGDSQCLRCPEDCNECSYNNITNETECQICNSYFVLSSNNKCISCGNACSFCTLDENDNPICERCSDTSHKLDKGRCIKCDEGCSDCIFDEYESSEYQIKTICTKCDTGYTFNSDKTKCIKCGNGCSACEFDKSSEYKNETICSECYSSYSLSPEGECILCNDPEIGGEGCGTCSYSMQTKKYKCNHCTWSNYVYVNNIYRCLSNTNTSQLDLYGCYTAQYDEKNDKYECLLCKSSSSIYIENEKICTIPSNVDLSSDCIRMENLGTLDEPKYSCILCKDGLTIAKRNSEGIKDCYDNDEEFQYCSEGIIEENGDYKCTKCVLSASLDSSGRCECNSGYFGKDKKDCYKCDNLPYGNPGCDSSKGCFYYSLYNFKCNECKKGYFQFYPNDKCHYCAEYIANCAECHFGQILNETDLICDNLVSIYFENKTINETINKTQEISGYIELKEYPEISPGCLISQKNLKEYFANKKCEYCKEGYFLTKEIAFIVDLKNMEALLAMNVDIKKIKMEKTQII